MLVVSYNPGYQNLLKGMKPSTRQRFVSLRFDFRADEQEESVLIGETACAPGPGQAPGRYRQRCARASRPRPEEAASTRLLVRPPCSSGDGMDPVAAPGRHVEPDRRRRRRRGPDGGGRRHLRPLTAGTSRWKSAPIRPRHVMPGPRLAVVAEALFLINLMLLPGLAFASR